MSLRQPWLWLYLVNVFLVWLNFQHHIWWLFSFEALSRIIHPVRWLFSHPWDDFCSSLHRFIKVLCESWMKQWNAWGVWVSCGLSCNCISRDLCYPIHGPFSFLKKRLEGFSVWFILYCVSVHLDSIRHDLWIFLFRKC